MLHAILLYTVLFGSGIAPGIAGGASGLLPPRQLNSICKQIAASTSNASEVYGIGSLNYAADIDHYMSSSTQSAECSFEPGTAEDVAIALQILGQSKTPFAVKGGGHTGNPGFSSTPGVQIAMTRFSDVSYNSVAQTATVGVGLIWDDVYMALEPYGVNVVGGRVTGVGVAGFTLGGGYSWLTNQYGLTIDTVQAYELVLPNGTVVDVTATANSDLFFALKGGLNNFGIVTRFTLKTFPQTQVWGGTITYAVGFTDQVNLATANFVANNSDPKAAIITSYNTVSGVPEVTELIFYDAPSPPPGLFDEFLAIPALLADVSTRSFLSLVQSSPSNATIGYRGLFNTISVTGYPLALIESIVNETIYWGLNPLLGSQFLISYNVESFSPTLFSHNSTPSAYPPSRTTGFLPLDIYFTWSLASFDEVFQDAARTTASTLLAQAINGGQNNIVDAPLYPNYAIFDTPLDKMYGANLPRLQAIKAAVDPNDVMGLAGGFKFKF